MAEHTPGPWKQSGRHVYAVGENGANICIVGEPRASKFVEYIPLEYGSKDSDEAYANASLIAAAPETAAERDRLRALNAELLAALDAMIETFGPWTPAAQGRSTIAQARAAIAKAEGRE